MRQSITSNNPVKNTWKTSEFRNSLF